MVDFNKLNLFVGIITCIGTSFTKKIGKNIYYLLNKCMHVKLKQIDWLNGWCLTPSLAKTDMYKVYGWVLSV